MKKVVLFLCVILFTGGTAAAQCDSAFQHWLSERDSMWFFPGGNYNAGDTVPESVATVDISWIRPYISFEYQSDSARFIYNFMELALNHRWLTFEKWCYGKAWNWNSNSSSDTNEISNYDLSSISRSDDFVVTTGDTITFFREFYLTKRFVDSLKSDWWHSDDAISVAIELVDSVTNNRVALLDTVFFAPTVTSKLPCYYARYPVAANVIYVIPPALNASRVYLRALVTSAGSDNYHFYRADNIDAVNSHTKLATSQWLEYQNALVANNSCPGGGVSCSFLAVSMSSPSRVRLSVVPLQTQLDELRIVTASGSVIGSYTLPLPSQPYDVSVSSGLYIVLGMNAGNAVCSKLVWVP